MKKFFNTLLILSVAMSTILAIPAMDVSAEGETLWKADGGVALSRDSGIVKNYYDPMLQIVMVRPTDGSLDFAMNSTGTDLYLHRVVLAYYNYEDGVTEAEADAQITELGADGKLSWGTVVYDFAMNGFPQQSVYGGSAVMLDENGMTMGSLSLAEVNKSDVLYYAAEFGEKAGSGLSTTWSNTSWVRGKIDYRDCIHGSNYVNYGECKIVHQDGDEVSKYWTYGRQPAADVHIMTWDEEWQAIQKARLDEIELKITEWEKLEDFAEFVGSNGEEVVAAEGKLEKLKVTLAKTGGEGVGILRDVRDDLAARLRRLQGKTDADDGDMGENDEENKGEQEETNKIIEIGSNNGVNNRDVNVKDGQNGADSSVDRRARYGGNIFRKSETEIAATNDNADNVVEAKDEQGNLLIPDGQKRNEEEVEVPNLGGDYKMNVWVALLPLLAGLLLLVLLALRKIWQKVQGKDIR